VYIRVDTVTGLAWLEEPEDTSRLSVLVVGDGDVPTALRGFGVIDGEHAWLDPDEIKAAAAGKVPDDWLADFATMLEHAVAGGWTSDDGTKLRAHIEYVEAPKPEKRRFLR
jgi:hypothetical protein